MIAKPEKASRWESQADGNVGTFVGRDIFIS
jgi:hypothetical protein